MDRMYFGYNRQTWSVQMAAYAGRTEDTCVPSHTKPRARTSWEEAD
jgi:hypothetical protein